MLKPAYCSGCGKRLEVPEGYTKSKLRCAECGVFNEVPKSSPAATGPSAPARPPATEAEPADDAYRFLAEPAAAEALAASPKPKAPKPKPQPKPVPDSEAPREVLIQGTVDDDGNPYQVTGDIATRRCPECEKKVDVRTAVCNYCGYNFETQEKTDRTFQPIDREWEAGWPFQKRLMLFMGLQAVNFVTLVASLLMSHGAGLSFIVILFSVGLQAFLVGTYERLRLRRTEKGKVTLIHTWRYAFFARPSEPVKWKEHDSVTVTRENEFDPIAWAFVFILLGYGCLPGIAFWWFVVRPDKFTVALCKDHGFPETPIFRTTDENRANEVRDAVSDISTLPIQK